MNICFIGFGNMAKAIAQGLTKHTKYSLSASAPSLTKGINKDNIHTYHDNKEAIQKADIIILALKPNQMGHVLKEIAPVLPKDCLLISIATGLSLSWFASHFKKEQAIIRTMPNTPAAIGLGATPMVANKTTTSEQKKAAEAIFSTIGITTWIDKESDIDAFTALSGSGPAYIFLFLESMIKAGVQLGLEEAEAKAFILQTFKGTVELAEKSSLNLRQLRDQVTSPGGTTAAALDILLGQLEPLLLKAIEAAKNRARVLGAG